MIWYTCTLWNDYHTQVNTAITSYSHFFLVSIIGVYPLQISSAQYIVDPWTKQELGALTPLALTSTSPPLSCTVKNLPLRLAVHTQGSSPEGSTGHRLGSAAAWVYSKRSTWGAGWAAVHGAAERRTDWATPLSLFTSTHWRRKWQPTPVFLPGESGGQGSLVGCRLWGRNRVGHDWATQQQ